MTRARKLAAKKALETRRRNAAASEAEQQQQQYYHHHQQQQQLGEVPTILHSTANSMDPEPALNTTSPQDQTRV